METVTKRTYEAMFLVDSALAASDWDGINELIKGIIEKYGGEIISMRKWDERRLAYEIKGTSRGTYILVYFKADTQVVKDIERSVSLNDKLMRVLVLNAEHMTEEDINKETPATAEKKKAEAVEKESDESEKSDESDEKEE